MNVAWITKGAVGPEEMAGLNTEQYLGILKTIEAQSS